MIDLTKESKEVQDAIIDGICETHNYESAAKHYKDMTGQDMSKEDYAKEHLRGMFLGYVKKSIARKALADIVKQVNEDPKFSFEKSLGNTKKEKEKE